MSQNHKNKTGATSALLALLIALSTGLSQAQTFTNIVINQWDDSTSWNTLSVWWGEPTISCEWDGTANTPPGPMGTNASSSGAMKVTVNWTPSQNQLMIWQEVDGNQTWWVNPEQRINGFYYDLSFDIKFDPSSSVAVNGGRGNLRFGVTTTDWAQRELAAFSPFPITNDWTHVDCKISPTLVGIDQITGWYMYYNWQPNNITNQQVFWIDNIIFYTNLNKDLKPPAQTLTPIVGEPGLRINAGSGDYPRQMIRPVEAKGDYTWYGQGSQPVTFSMTISEYPQAPYTNFQSHIFLVPNPGTENSPDWNQPNTIALMIENNLDGTANGFIRYKTNLPGGNNMMYNSQPTNGPVGHLATLAAPTPIGTWSMSFTHNTNILVSGPGGVSTNVYLTEDAAVLFSSLVRPYFGNQNNGAWKSGQYTTLSRVQIQGGGAANIDDTFPGPDINQDPQNPFWEKIANTPAGINVITTNDIYVLTWTLPDLNFNTVQVSSNLTDWINTDLQASAILRGATRSVVVKKTDLPSLTSSYFRLVKRVATKLQVLLPGETAAPGTPTGKTGTPTPQPWYVPFEVVVNAVDNDWNIVPSVTDTVTLTSSDPAIYIEGPTVALANGTTTYALVYFQTLGNQTLTATDISNSNVAAGVSASVNVTQ